MHHAYREDAEVDFSHSELVCEKRVFVCLLLQIKHLFLGNDCICI